MTGTAGWAFIVLLAFVLIAASVVGGIWLDGQSSRRQWIGLAIYLAVFLVGFLTIPLWVHSGRIGF